MHIWRKRDLRSWRGPCCNARSLRSDHPAYREHCQRGGGESDRDAGEAERVTAAALPQQSDDGRAKKSAEAAHRVEQPDPCGCSAAGEESGGKAEKRTKGSI